MTLLQRRDEPGRATNNAQSAAEAGALPAPSRDDADTETGHLAELAERELRDREARSRYLPDEFCSETPWVMLLELFAAERYGRIRCETDLGEGGLIAQRSASRWFAALEQAGFVTCEGGLKDPNVRFASLTLKGRDAVAGILKVRLQSRS